MSNEETLKEKRQEHLDVDVRNISPLNRAGGNIRVDYGDIDELAESIAQNGIIIPLRAYRSEENPEKYIAIDGHRRLTAAMKLVNERGLQIRAKVIIVDRRKISDDQLIYEMVITNEGKQLNPVELAEAVRRLIGLGHDPKEIAARFGKPVWWVKNLDTFSAAPKRIRDMVINGNISYSTVLRTLKENQDYNKAMEIIEKAYSTAVKTKQEKISAGDGLEDIKMPKIRIARIEINEASNKLDSFKELVRVVNNQENSPKELTNLELYDVLRKIVRNKLSKTDLETILYK